MQHTFAAAFRDLAHRGKRELALKPWLYAIARNRCLSMLRSRHEHTALDFDLPTEGLSEQVERRAELRDLLRDLLELPEEQRAALLLSQTGNLSHAEVADVLGCQVANVKALVFRARSGLIQRREARETACADIREQLANLRGNSLRRSELRHHLRSCAGCRAYREQVKAPARRCSRRRCQWSLRSNRGRACSRPPASEEDHGAAGSPPVWAPGCPRPWAWARSSRSPGLACSSGALWCRARPWLQTPRHCLRRRRRPRRPRPLPPGRRRRARGSSPGGRSRTVSNRPSPGLPKAAPTPWRARATVGSHTAVRSSARRQPRRPRARPDAARSAERHRGAGRHPALGITAPVPPPTAARRRATPARGARDRSTTRRGARRQATPARAARPRATPPRAARRQATPARAAPAGHRGRSRSARKPRAHSGRAERQP